MSKICKRCKREASFFSRLAAGFSGLCSSCSSKIEKAKILLEEAGITYDESDDHIYVSMISTPLRELLPKKYMKDFLLGMPLVNIISNKTRMRLYDSLIEDLISHNYENIEQIVNDICEKIVVDFEKKQIEQRKKKLDLKHKAEKEYFGKIRSKRQKLGKDEIDAIFDKFNHECAICGTAQGLHIHHKNKNPNDNRIDNLLVLCGLCHKKIHMRVR